MYQGWLLISDACGPELEPRAIAHVEYHQPFGMLCLGNPVLKYNTDSQRQTLRCVICKIQYFNDADDPTEPESIGNMMELDLTELCKDRPMVTPVCDMISEAVFGTHVAFETFPELNVLPIDNDRGVLTR